MLDISEFFGLPRLGEQGIRTYEFAVGRKTFTLADLVQDTGLDCMEAREALEHLVRCRLAHCVGHDSDRYEAVPPDRARTLLLGEPVRKVNRWMHEIDSVRDELARLVPIYEASLVRRMCSQSVELFPDPDCVRQVITELAARCSTEVLTAQPGGARAAEVLKESAGRTAELLERGVRMRTLYQYAAQFDPATVAFVQDIAAKGAEVRTVSGLLNRMIAFDGKGVLIELRHRPGGAALVHDPSVVDFMVATFEQSWLTAAPFPTEHDRSRLSWTTDAVKREIMRLFVQGVEDKIISRRLGISTRTCQRHISDIMQRVGARNRAHAGYLISERRLLAAAAG
jgi:hypothetical protein